MSVRLRRAYEPPADDDGHRVLVDRVWPRGRSREALALDRWAREVAPSTRLRKWFGHDPARWETFRDRYRAELARPPQADILRELTDIARHGVLTVVAGARDIEHSQGRVVADEIQAAIEERT